MEGYAEALAAIERACGQLQQPAHRIEGEQVLLAFRRSANVLPVCQYILDNASSAPVQFQVGITLREAAVRDYTLLSETEVEALQSYLLNYLYARPTLENYARETIISCITVIIKRGWLEDSEQKRQAILHRITELLNTDLAGKRLSLGLLQGLLTEFSSDKSASVGLSWDFHNRCKAAFEKLELRHVFDIALQVVRAGLESDDWWAGHADGRYLMNLALQALSASLSWDFAKDDTGLESTIAKKQRDEDEVAVSTPLFPETWRDVLVRPDVLDVFFHAYAKFLNNATYLGKVEECLTQLAGLRGKVFADELSRKGYADHFMKGMLPVIASYSKLAETNEDTDVLGPVIRAQAQMIKRFLSTFRVALIHDLPNFQPFLEHAGALSEIALKNMIDSVEEMWDEEAFDELLSGWATLVADTINLQHAPVPEGQASRFDPNIFLGVLRNVASNLFQRYIDTRLQIAQNDIEQEIYAGDGKDYELYSDQLVSLASLARLDPQRNLAKLHELLMDRLGRLQQWFAGATEDDNYLAAVHEHTHWIILITAYVLADTGLSEKPLLPEPLVNLAREENGRCPMSATSDSIGTVTKAVFDLLDYASVDPLDSRAPDLSPMVAETAMFFLGRWIMTYLFIEASDYKQLPATLVAAYGRPDHGGHGAAVLESILDILNRTFKLWSTESDVLIQSVAVLEAFSKNKFLENATLSSGRFRDLVAWFLNNLANLPEDTHSLLIETVARIVSGAPDETLRLAYLESLGQAIDKRLQQVLNRPDFQAVYQSQEVLIDVDSVLEMFTGLALAADPTNSKQIFTFCAGYLPSFVKLFDIYANRAEVVVVILQFFEAFVRNQDFEQLTAEDKQKIYSSVIDILKVYAAHNSGKRFTSQASEEDEAHQDISAMLEILTNMMAAEFQGLPKDELSSRKAAAAKAGPGSVDVADVVFYGVNIVLPLITDDMLKYPRLCRLYCHLTSDLLEFFPEKLAQLPPELFASLLRTLTFGIESALPEVAETTYAAITALAVYVKYSAAGSSPTSVTFLEPHLDTLLQLVLNMLLLRDFDADLVDTAAESVLALVYCRHNTYTQMISDIVASQPAGPQARLVAAFTKLNAVMEKALSRANPGDATTGGLGIPNRTFAEYLRVFESVLVEARGLLRVK